MQSVALLTPVLGASDIHVSVIMISPEGEMLGEQRVRACHILL